jgi:hypothetical protein
MWVILGQISGQGVTKVVSYDLPHFQAKTKILPDVIRRTNHLHADPCQYLLTYTEDGNLWFWVAHLGPMWVILGQICGQGVTKSHQLWFVQLSTFNFQAKILQDAI